MRAAIEADLAELFEGVGADGFVHACDIDGGAEVGLHSDDLVVTASVFKVPVMLELARQAAAGEVDLRERVVVPAGRRTIGPTGISAMRDEVEMSVRDLAYLMMSVSDNTATDVLMERVGTDRIAATLASLGLRQTVVAEDCAALLAGFASDIGIRITNSSEDDQYGSIPNLDPSLLASARALTPSQTNRTTPREMATLLAMIWRNEAGPPEACAEVRGIMARQVWPHRLSSAFPDGVAVAGKTGTLAGIRNEAGVVTYPDRRRYAVAVFTRARSFAMQQPAIDAAIGTAARMDIDHLRSA